MGILASSLFKDVQQQIQKEQNGDLSYDDFNRLSKIAELNIMEWITGDLRGNIPPEPYLTQKNKDWLSPFITKYKSSLDSEAQITKPADYYGYENMYSLSLSEMKIACDEDAEDLDCGETLDEAQEVVKTPIQLLDGSAFTIRANTYIKSLKPSLKKPIAKEIGNKFEFLPAEIGGVTLEYIRYPVYANIVTILDTTYNELVVDEAATTNYEWPDNARKALMWFIIDLFSNSVRENALKAFNQATGKTVNP